MAYVNNKNLDLINKLRNLNEPNLDTVLKKLLNSSTTGNIETALNTLYSKYAKDSSSKYKNLIQQTSINTPNNSFKNANISINTLSTFNQQINSNQNLSGNSKNLYQAKNTTSYGAQSTLPKNSNLTGYGYYTKPFESNPKYATNPYSPALGNKPVPQETITPQQHKVLFANAARNLASAFVENNYSEYGTLEMINQDPVLGKAPFVRQVTKAWEGTIRSGRLTGLLVDSTTGTRSLESVKNITNFLSDISNGIIGKHYNETPSTTNTAFSNSATPPSTINSTLKKDSTINLDVDSSNNPPSKKSQSLGFNYARGTTPLPNRTTASLLSTQDSSEGILVDPSKKYINGEITKAEYDKVFNDAVANNELNRVKENLSKRGTVSDRYFLEHYTQPPAMYPALDFNHPWIKELTASLERLKNKGYGPGTPNYEQSRNEMSAYMRGKFPPPGGDGKVTPAFKYWIDNVSASEAARWGFGNAYYNLHNNSNLKTTTEASAQDWEPSDAFAPSGSASGGIYTIPRSKSNLSIAEKQEYLFDKSPGFGLSPLKDKSIMSQIEKKYGFQGVQNKTQEMMQKWIDYWKENGRPISYSFAMDVINDINLNNGTGKKLNIDISKLKF